MLRGVGGRARAGLVDEAQGHLGEIRSTGDLLRERRESGRRSLNIRIAVRGEEAALADSDVLTKMREPEFLDNTGGAVDHRHCEHLSLDEHARHEFTVTSSRSFSKCSKRTCLFLGRPPP